METRRCKECGHRVLELKERSGLTEMAHEADCDIGRRQRAQRSPALDPSTVADRQLRDDPPVELLQAVGAVTIAAGRAEFCSRQILQLIAGLKLDVASTLLDSRGWGWILDQISSLAPQVGDADEDLEQDLQQWARASQEPRVQRNVFLHGAMTFISVMNMEPAPPTVVDEVEVIFMEARSRKGSAEVVLHRGDLIRLWNLAAELEGVEITGSRLLKRLRTSIGHPDDTPELRERIEEENETDLGLWTARNEP